MTSLFYPLHTKGARIRVVGRSKLSGQYGTIQNETVSNRQIFFTAKLDSGKSISLHAESLQIVNEQPATTTDIPNE